MGSTLEIDQAICLHELLPCDQRGSPSALGNGYANQAKGFFARTKPMVRKWASSCSTASNPASFSSFGKS